MMPTQIRRKQGPLDFIPAYSTVQLLQGICHLTHVPKNGSYSPVPESVRAAHAARQEKSRKKFVENKEEIYALFAHGRGIKCVASQFSIGVDALQRYLEEQEEK